VSDVTGAGTAVAGAASAGATIYAANKQFQIASQYSSRAQEIHDLQRSRLSDDIQIWQSYARQGLIDQVSRDSAEPIPVARYDEMQARSEAIVRLGFGRARQQLSECADIYCVGPTTGQFTQLRVAEAVALADVASFARTREESRVDLRKQVRRDNIMNGIAAVRGNYNHAMSGMSALAQLFQQTGSQAGAAAGASLAAGATMLGRAFGGPNKRDAIPMSDAGFDAYVNERSRQESAVSVNDFGGTAPSFDPFGSVGGKQDPFLQQGQQAAIRSGLPGDTFDPTWASSETDQGF
jgi:hypothetical protein